MGAPLNKDSMMECARHGVRRPAFICQHLRLGHGLGFNKSEEPFDPEWPFQNVWCDACDKVLTREGEWNDVSEGFAGILAICEGCLEEIRGRNQLR